MTQILICEYIKLILPTPHTYQYRTRLNLEGSPTLQECFLLID